MSHAATDYGTNGLKIITPEPLAGPAGQVLNDNTKAIDAALVGKASLVSNTFTGSQIIAAGGSDPLLRLERTNGLSPFRGQIVANGFDVDDYGSITLGNGDIRLDAVESSILAKSLATTSLTIFPNDTTDIIPSLTWVDDNDETLAELSIGGSLGTTLQLTDGANIQQLLASIDVRNLFSSNGTSCIDPSLMGSGIANSGRFLRGDNSWQAISVDLSSRVPTTRLISTTSPLAGGGDLSADRTISFSSQAINTVFSGPGSGSSAAPSFRSLVLNDLPSGVALLGSANAFTAQNTFAAGTITTSQPVTITQTWNTLGTTYTSFLLNVTNSSSAAASLLMDLQTGGTSRFKVDKAGNITAAGGITEVGTLNLTPPHLGTGLWIRDAVYDLAIDIENKTFQVDVDGDLYCDNISDYSTEGSVYAISGDGSAVFAGGTFTIGSDGALDAAGDQSGFTSSGGMYTASGLFTVDYHGTLNCPYAAHDISQVNKYTLVQDFAANPNSSNVPASAMGMYRKGSKLVVIYNSAGTMHYNILDPTTGVWTHTTTAP